MTGKRAITTLLDWPANDAEVEPMPVVDVDTHWECAAPGTDPLAPWADLLPKGLDSLAFGVAGDLLRALAPGHRPESRTLLPGLVRRPPLPSPGHEHRRPRPTLRPHLPRVRTELARPVPARVHGTTHPPCRLAISHPQRPAGRLAAPVTAHERHGRARRGPSSPLDYLRGAQDERERFITAFLTAFVTGPCPRGACDEPRRRWSDALGDRRRERRSLESRTREP